MGELFEKALAAVTSFEALPAASIHRAAAAIAREPLASWPTIVAPPLAVAASYFLAAKLGQWLAFPAAPVSAFWAPNAILLAALILTPRKHWWMYLLAVLPFHFAAQLPGSPASRVVIQYALNCAEAVMAAWALQRLCPQPRCFDRARSTIVLIVFGGILAPLVTSVLMAGAFSVLDLSHDFWLTTAARTVTNAAASIALVPLLVHGFERVRAGRREFALARAVEAGVLAACITCVGFLVFVYPAATPQPVPALLYAPLPILAWTTMRFGTTGACGAALLFGGLSTWGVLNGHGPFTTHNPIHNAMSVVAFQAVTSMALLIFSAVLAEFRRAEAGRKMAEGLHTAVMASLHDQIAILDNRGTVVEINDSWRRFVETTRPPRFDAVLPGQNFLAACAGPALADDAAAAEQLDAVRAVLSGSETHRQIELSQISEARPRWFEVSIEQLPRKAGGAVIVRTEVTARKQAESDARDQHEQLAHLGRAAVLGELSGAFAHELNQPLTSILGNAEAALQLLSHDTADLTEIKAILCDIVQDDERAAQVIQRLRDLMRKGERQRQPVDLNAVVREVLQLARSELIARNVCVTMNLDTHVRPIAADRVQMHQVILNLLMNACEAMTGVRPPERKLSLSTRLIWPSGCVEVAVTDSGCGIPDDDLEYIFQPFVTTKPHGMGLGLAICRSVAEAHHGSLSAENASSGGAIFRLSVPLEGGIPS